MSKHLEAFKIIEEEIIRSINDGRTKRIVNLYKEQLQIIEQALKRNEPMKPIKDKEDHRCPKCAHIVDNHYCSDCGQALDWSDEND